MKLTARQINMLDEIERDRKAIQETLQVALNFHANRLNEINESHAEMWKEFAEHHGFDLYAGCGWCTKMVDGAMHIVSKPQE